MSSFCSRCATLWWGPVASVTGPRGCGSLTLCEAFTPIVVLNCEATRNDTCEPTQTASDRPPSPRQYSVHTAGTTIGRASPSHSAHVSKDGSTRSAGPPRVQLRSQNVVPSWPSVAPTCTQERLLSCTCPLVFAARSS